MTEENLQYLKRKYQDWKKAVIDYNSKVAKKASLENEIKEMENDEVIKEYLRKKDEVEFLDSKIAHIRRAKGNLLRLNEEEIINYFRTPWIWRTNGIYVCIGEYAKKNYFSHDINNLFFYPEPDKSRILPINSDEGVYRAYLDIECDSEIIKSKSMDMNDFEKENIVLYPGEENPLDFYNKVRLLFFKTCIENTQEEAIAKVLELKK